jgi:hypothetical protein
VLERAAECRLRRVADVLRDERDREGGVAKQTRAESQMRRRRTRHGIDVRAPLSPQDAIQFFRENQIALIYDQATGALRADKSETAKTIIKKAS